MGSTFPFPFSYKAARTGIGQKNQSDFHLISPCRLIPCRSEPARAHFDLSVSAGDPQSSERFDAVIVSLIRFLIREELAEAFKVSAQFLRSVRDICHLSPTVNT
jgi:hypothetical protein